MRMLVNPSRPRRRLCGRCRCVQGVAQHTARPDLNPVLQAVQDRVRQMQAEEDQTPQR
jgi:hypothetical protein